MVELTANDVFRFLIKLYIEPLGEARRVDVAVRCGITKALQNVDRLEQVEPVVGAQIWVHRRRCARAMPLRVNCDKVTEQLMLDEGFPGSRLARDQHRL